MGPGTLYAVLARLEQAGYIEPLASDEDGSVFDVTGTVDSVCDAVLDRLRRHAP